jgi:hypothetical protein
VHRRKQDSPKITTDDGITIDFNPLPPNADSPITSVVETLSKTTTDTGSNTREHNFTDEKTQRRLSDAEGESDEQTVWTTPLSTNF